MPISGYNSARFSSLHADRAVRAMMIFAFAAWLDPPAMPEQLAALFRTLPHELLTPCGSASG